MRVVLLGGSREVGLAILAAVRAAADTEVMLAGRDEQRLAAGGKELHYSVTTLTFDALAAQSHASVIDAAFAAGPVDVVIAATGILVPQDDIDREPNLAAPVIDTNFTNHVTTLLAAAAKMRAQGAVTIVVLSSVAAIRPRRANFVYGAAKAGLDAFARRLADPLARRRPRGPLV